MKCLRIAALLVIGIMLDQIDINVSVESFSGILLIVENVNEVVKDGALAERVDFAAGTEGGPTVQAVGLLLLLLLLRP